MLVITTRELIDANKKALAEGTLGALKHQGDRDGAKYVYPDGCRCALGAVFSDTMAAAVERDSVNSAGIDDLIYSKLVTFEHYMIAYWTQALHDSWAADMRAPGSSYEAPAELRPFLDTRCCNRVITEETFRDWIALLDRTYPVENPA